MIITSLQRGSSVEKKSRERQHVKHLDSLRMWLQKENTEIIHSVRDRKKYRESMITMSKGT